MKVRIDIECSPEEARSFFGLPPVAEMQQEVIAELSQRMREAMRNSDTESLLRAWMPNGLEGLEQMQKAFWAAAGGAGAKEPKD